MSIPPPNYTQVPNVLLDVLGDLTDAELRVAMAICRQTFGWHKERDALSLSQLQRLTGRSRPVVSDGLQGLIARGWVDRTPVRGRGGQSYAYRLAVEVIGADPPPDNPPEVVGRTTSSPAYQYPSLPPGHTAPDAGLTHQDAENPQVVGYATSSVAYPQKKDLERKNPPPPTPTPEPEPASPGGGGGIRETQDLLRAAGVRAPSVIRRLAGIEPAVVRRAVRALERESGIKSLAGALVGTLDEYLRTGDEISPAPPGPARAAPAPPPLPAAPPIDPARRAALVAAARARRPPPEART